MGADEIQLPRIDFSGIDPSAPGTGPWPAVRAQVMDALATFGCFDAQYPALTPELRDALFDGAAKPLFALPLDVKRRNYYGPELPFHGHLGGRPGHDGYMSLGIVDGNKAEHIRTFADLMWPDGDGGISARFCEAVHGASTRVTELDAVVRRMVMEGLGVAKYHDALNESTWHLFRLAEYKPPNAAEEVVRYGSHQDANLLSIVCQHEVDGLETDPLTLVRGTSSHWHMGPATCEAHTSVTLVRGTSVRLPPSGWPGGADQGRGVVPRQAVADVARRHGRQRTPGMVK